MITTTMVNPTKIRIRDNGDYPVISFEDGIDGTPAVDVSILLVDYAQLENLITLCKAAYETFLANESQTTRA